MTFRKAVYGLCIMLMLATQFLVAQHTSIHPVEANLLSAIGEHSHEADHHHTDHKNNNCQSCDFIKNVSHSMAGIAPIIALILVMSFIAYNSKVIAFAAPRLKTSSYYSQAPPKTSFSTI